MGGTGEEKTGFEIALVVSKKDVEDGRDEHHGRCCSDCAEFLVLELEKVGLAVERVVGVSDEFLKLGAPMAVLGRAAAELEIRKPTYIGLDLQFEWDEVDAFVRQPDGTLFSWCERFRCYMHLIYGIVNQTGSVVNLDFDGRRIRWDIGRSLVEVLESEDLVKEVFPLHEETKRKHLLKNWALNWMDFTQQPIDEIYSYFGMKIATYFAFLGMYTRWIFFPAALGLALQLIDFGSWRSLMPPAFFTLLISWAVMFLQFWKRKNSAMLARWKTSHPAGVGMRCNLVNTEKNYHPSHTELAKKVEEDKLTEKQAYQRDEWFGHLLRFRNDAFFISSIICLQLPFELAYAHLYEIARSDIIKFGLTAVYLLIIQYLTKIGGKVSVKLIKCEYNRNSESKADSLIYKVFGLYFMQTYIGLFYHAILHRNFLTLRKILTQRMIASQVLQSFVENCIPYLKYSFKKHRTVNKNNKGKLNGKVQLTSRVEKEHLKPSYSASIGEELEDGLFDDFLELALQFGMIMMFACAFPLAFCLAALNNAAEIRTDALKLLAMMRRPVPRASATIGAWLNIFQFLLVMSICTNCALLVCLYDQERKWRLEPGLAAILVMEHVLLFFKFGFSRFVPEEPAWVRASRLKNAEQAQYLCSRKFLRKASIEREKWREKDE